MSNNLFSYTYFITQIKHNLWLIDVTVFQKEGFLFFLSITDVPSPCSSSVSKVLSHHQLQAATKGM